MDMETQFISHFNIEIPLSHQRGKLGKRKKGEIILAGYKSTCNLIQFTTPYYYDNYGTFDHDGHKYTIKIVKVYNKLPIIGFKYYNKTVLMIYKDFNKICQTKIHKDQPIVLIYDQRKMKVIIGLETLEQYDISDCIIYSNSNKTVSKTSILVVIQSNPNNNNNQNSIDF